MVEIAKYLTNSASDLQVFCLVITTDYCREITVDKFLEKKIDCDLNLCR